MTNEQILKKAIDKAVKNGLSEQLVERMLNINTIRNLYFTNIENHTNDIIFSHDFAKAFWGKREVCAIDGCVLWFSPAGGYKKCPQCKIEKFIDGIDKIYEWQYHLQQMVLEEDPIKYLEQFI